MGNKWKSNQARFYRFSRLRDRWEEASRRLFQGMILPCRVRTVLLSMTGVAGRGHHVRRSGADDRSRRHHHAMELRLRGFSRAGLG
jgi:hypothetical protein